MKVPNARVPDGALAFAVLSVFLSISTITEHAAAAGPLGGNGTPITTSAYTLDGFQGPILGSGRTTALAGSTGAIPEGALGNTVSSASPAARDPWSTDWFDWDVDATLSLPSTLKRSDFDNNGRAGLAYESFLYASFGGLLQFGRWGVSASAEVSTFQLGGGAGQPRLDATLSRGRVALARQFLDGALIVGVGVRSLELTFDSVTPAGQETEILSLSGSALQGGVLVAPRGLPFRVALEGRSSVNKSQIQGSVSPDAAGDLVVTDPTGRPLFVPQSARLPWEIELATAIQFGRRPLNIAYHDPSDGDRALAQRLINQHAASIRKWHGRDLTLEERKQLVDHARAIRHARDRRRIQALPRQKVLLTASLLVSGPVANAVGAESFLLQTVERSGRRVSITPRAGVELEPLPGRLQVRGGTYLEPSRFDHRQPRLHGTFGWDLRVLQSSVFGLWAENTHWRIGSFVDLAPRYASVSATIGVWH
jgi:hypothetical protein